MSDESDEPFRFAINPVVMERNARRLVDIMAQYFPGGATSKDLQIRFEQVTGLQRQSFYDTIGFAKYKRWLIGGGKNKLYQLNSDGSWKPTQTSAGQILEKDRLEYLADSRARQIEDLQGEVERLRDWASGSDANGANNVALSNLIKIVADNSASPRQRLRAAAAVLGYKTPNDITDFVKKYLESLCGSDEAVDYKIEASELLRKHEAPRVTPESVRPSYRDSEGTEAERREAWRNYEIAERELKIILAAKDTPPPGWADDLYSDDYVPPPEGWPGPAPVIPLKDLVVARKARQDRLCPESAASRFKVLAGANGKLNGNDEPSDSGSEQTHSVWLSSEIELSGNPLFARQKVSKITLQYQGPHLPKTEAKNAAIFPYSSQLEHRVQLDGEQPELKVIEASD